MWRVLYAAISSSHCASFDPARSPITNAISTQPQSSSNTTSIPSSCHLITTPACIQDLYGIPKTLATQSNNKLFVSGFGGEYANKEDLSSFLATYRPDMSPNTTFSTVSVNGGINNQTLSKAGVEANLDIQYTVGLASGVPTSFVTVGPQIANTTEFYHTLQDEANYILKMDKPPTVLTSSYSNLESSLSRSFARCVQCFLFAYMLFEPVGFLEQYVISTCNSVHEECRFYFPAETQVSVVCVCYNICIQLNAYPRTGVGGSYDCSNSTSFAPHFPG